MRIRISSTGMTLKEFLSVLERVLKDNNITKIDNPNIYLGNSKTVIETTLHRKEIDTETREQAGIDSIAF